MAIELGDLVNVTLGGQRPRVLNGYEVIRIPTNNFPYWEFANVDESVAVPVPIAVAKNIV